ncbi:(deoxy)nucleoside triphosphate pyrophosphohydrolase [uncultured Olsenella sp.]|uniref:(deoxy)nucleoside triphosphate pyrophosphohydrolase n=1 Tax=uncultured Olsenella sp. TaxID=190764 RepID=UPI0026DBBC9B|nr:(deoxy)nucleoside triphosphate pyrophosphohydrolase [uncultured Olsenella sp.]
MEKTKVVCAIVQRGGKVLAARRGHGMERWEFPGGKVEEGESREEALRREVREELGCELSTIWYLDSVDYEYPGFHLDMDCFVCSLAEGEDPVLREHRELRWLGRDELTDVDWLPADHGLIMTLGVMWDSVFESSHL